MNETRRQSIREYFPHSSARAEDMPNPLFAGRDEQIDAVLTWTRKLDAALRPPPNMTAIFYGAPGAGKSEALLQVRRAIERADGLRNAVVFLEGGAELLTDAGAVSDAIYAASPPERQRRLEKRGWRLDSVTALFGPVSATARREAGEPPAQEITKLRGVARDVMTAYGGMAPTVVLLIDEAQQELRAVGKGDFPLALHKGQAGLKALTVYGGLGNTVKTLGDVGVTRPGDHMRFLLKGLDDATVRSIATEALEAVTNQAPEVVGGWVDVIVAHSQEWPAHLSGALQAVAARSRANGWAVGQDGFEAAMSVAELKREQYYGDRLHACPLLQPEIFAPWASLFKNEAVATAADVSGALRLPRKDGDALVEQAVGAGLLEAVRPGCYASPIPSLVDHIEGQGRMLARCKTRGRGGR